LKNPAPCIVSNRRQGTQFNQPNQPFFIFQAPCHPRGGTALSTTSDRLSRGRMKRGRQRILGGQVLHLALQRARSFTGKKKTQEARPDPMIFLSSNGQSTKIGTDSSLFARITYRKDTGPEDPSWSYSPLWCNSFLSTLITIRVGT
jgi:hypothetical protein